MAFVGNLRDCFSLLNLSSAAADTDVGFVNIYDDGTTVTIWTCYATPCGSDTINTNEVQVE